MFKKFKILKQLKFFKKLKKFKIKKKTVYEDEEQIQLNDGNFAGYMTMLLAI